MFVTFYSVIFKVGTNEGFVKDFLNYFITFGFDAGTTSFKSVFLSVIGSFF
jgi:hypothetical protein